MRVGAVSMRGWRETMEDTHRIELGLGDRFADTAFIGLYDGHGGDGVSRSLADDARGLHVKLAALGGLSDAEIKAAVVDYDRDLRRQVEADDAESSAGSTCIFALISPDRVEGQYHVAVANVGDSRALLLHADGSVDELSRDHKPMDEDESERIYAAGGCVFYNRVDGQLAVSRAIGDWHLKTWRCHCEANNRHSMLTARCDTCGATRQGPELQPGELKVSAMPDIMRVVARSSDKLMLFCDGVVECMSNGDVGKIVHAPPKEAQLDAWKRDPAVVASRCLVRSFDEGSRDNHSAVLVYFSDGSDYNARTEVIDVEDQVEK